MTGERGAESGLQRPRVARVEVRGVDGEPEERGRAEALAVGIVALRSGRHVAAELGDAHAGLGRVVRADGPEHAGERVEVRRVRAVVAHRLGSGGLRGQEAERKGGIGHVLCPRLGLERGVDGPHAGSGA